MKINKEQLLDCMNQMAENSKEWNIIKSLIEGEDIDEVTADDVIEKLNECCLKYMGKEPFHNASYEEYENNLKQYKLILRTITIIKDSKKKKPTSINEFIEETEGTNATNGQDSMQQHKEEPQGDIISQVVMKRNNFIEGLRNIVTMPKGNGSLRILKVPSELGKKTFLGGSKDVEKRKKYLDGKMSNVGIR